MSLAEARSALAGAGFELVGTLAAPDYDALVPAAWKLARRAPGARGVWVVGHAGRALWPRFTASPEARLGRDPLAAYSARVLADAAARAGPGAGWALDSERHEGSYAPLVALAERAGLGAPGRLGLLLHPVYGPWISLRGLLFTPEPIASPPPTRFAPCDGCPAPCVQACHAGAIDARGLDGERCYAARRALAACAARCDARLACPLGREHAYGPAQLAHHYRIRSG